MTPQLQTFLWGVVGSLAVDLITLADYLNDGKAFPRRYRKPLFYIVRLLIAALGGGLALAYGIGSDKPFLALNIGAATPLIIRQFAQTIPRGQDDD